MTKSDLILRLAERLNNPALGLNAQVVQRDCEVSVRLLLDAMMRSLIRGDRIEIRGFGTFSVNVRPPRVGRNPKSGQGLPCRPNAYRISSLAKTFAFASISSRDPG